MKRSARGRVQERHQLGAIQVVRGGQRVEAAVEELGGRDRVGDVQREVAVEERTGDVGAERLKCTSAPQCRTSTASGASAREPPIVAFLARLLDAHRRERDREPGVARPRDGAPETDELHPVELDLAGTARDHGLELLGVPAERHELRLGAAAASATRGASAPRHGDAAPTALVQRAHRTALDHWKERVHERAPEGLQLGDGNMQAGCEAGDVEARDAKRRPAERSELLAQHGFVEAGTRGGDEHRCARRLGPCRRRLGDDLQRRSGVATHGQHQRDPPRRLVRREQALGVARDQRVARDPDAVARATRARSGPGCPKRSTQPWRVSSTAKTGPPGSLASSGRPASKTTPMPARGAIAAARGPLLASSAPPSPASAAAGAPCGACDRSSAARPRSTADLPDRRRRSPYRHGFRPRRLDRARRRDASGSALRPASDDPSRRGIHRRSRACRRGSCAASRAERPPHRPPVRPSAPSLRRPSGDTSRSRLRRTRPLLPALDLEPVDADRREVADGAEAREVLRRE